MGRRRVLFVCTHNSARSQMAEGLLRSLAGERFDPASAGTVATRVRPEASIVMRELGIDISQQRSKSLDAFAGQSWDVVVTVCDQARESCPVIPGARRTLHWSLDDPAAVAGDETERLAAFRAVRDELLDRIDAELIHSRPR